jgi:hypothetical protein
MRTLAAAALLAGCQCLATPGATGPMAPLVPGAPGLPVTVSAPPPAIMPLQVPAVSIVPGAVSMGGGVPTPPEPVTAMVPMTSEPEPPGHGHPHHPRTTSPVTALPDTVVPDPGLSADQIRRVVQAAAGRVRRCYEPRLEHEPNLSGRVTISLAVAADGSVTSADVRDSFDVEIGGCVSNVLSALSFPTSPVGGTAVIPFDFSPPAPPPANPGAL